MTYKEAQKEFLRASVHDWLEAEHYGQAELAEMRRADVDMAQKLCSTAGFTREEIANIARSAKPSFYGEHGFYL